VRIKVHACGICHSDLMVKAGHMPGIEYPRIPGHEVAGVVDVVGPGVTAFQPGDKVGVGWFGGACHQCKNCRKNEWVTCQKGKACGLSYNGGYAEYMVAPVDAIARVPSDLSFEEAAPLLCAGITTYNAIRHQNVLPGGVVAVQGVGGLGHLAIQYAHRMGYVVVALSTGKDKEAMAKQLGANHYIDGTSSDTVQELQKLGGADLIVCTAPSAKAIEPLVGGLAVGGKLLIVAGVTDKLQVNPIELLMGKKSIVGWASGDSRDSEDTLNFSANLGVKPMIETFPLAKANEALTRMEQNKARFRCVLLPGK